MWTIDTTGPDGWVQISKSTGLRLALKCNGGSLCVPAHLGQDRIHRSTSHVAVPKGDTTPALSPEAQAFDVGAKFSDQLHKGRKMIHAVPKGDIALAPSLEAFDVDVGFSDQLQQKWETIYAVLQKSSASHLSKEDMMKSWVLQSDGDGFEHIDLADQTITDIFLKMDLQKRGAIEEVEWLHYWLLERTAPSFDALSQVNKKLVSYMRKDPSILKRLNELFLVSCKHHLRVPESDVQMSAQHLLIAANAWLDEARKCKSMHDIVDYLVELLQSQDLDEGEPYSYYDFMNHMLGRRKEKVRLYQYDLTKGGAKWLSPLLVGQQLEGLWHTSIVVFGREYWFGGSVFEAPPGTTCFGKPDKIIDLPEQTMHTKADFIRHLARRMAHDFTAENYDILTHNCNHFTDAASLFLLNSHIPQDVLMQPDLVMGSWSFTLLRPVVNRALGQCQARGSTKELLPTKEASTPCTDSDMISDDILVIWDDDDGRTRIARVLSVSHESKTCALKWLDVLMGELHTAMEVSIRKVRKLKSA